jgi:hypothetical protein
MIDYIKEDDFCMHGQELLKTLGISRKQLESIATKGDENIRELFYPINWGKRGSYKAKISDMNNLKLGTMINDNKYFISTNHANEQGYTMKLDNISADAKIFMRANRLPDYMCFVDTGSKILVLRKPNILQRVIMWLQKKMHK